MLQNAQKLMKLAHLKLFALPGLSVEIPVKVVACAFPSVMLLPPDQTQCFWQAALRALACCLL